MRCVATGPDDLPLIFDVPLTYFRRFPTRTVRLPVRQAS
jgi:hypothetical protein